MYNVSIGTIEMYKYYLSLFLLQVRKATSFKLSKTINGFDQRNIASSMFET